MSETSKEGNILEDETTIRNEIKALESKLLVLKAKLLVIEGQNFEKKLLEIPDQVERDVERECRRANSSVIKGNKSTRMYISERSIQERASKNYSAVQSLFSARGYMFLRGSSFSGDTDDYTDYFIY
jgi:hypothetical protein